MLCTADELAAYLVHFYDTQNTPVNDVQLQQILWYLQAIYANWRHAPSHNFDWRDQELLFTDRFTAWSTLPLIWSVYLKYEPFGPNPITETPEAQLQVNSLDKRFIDTLAKKIREKNYLELAEPMQHRRNPWQKALRNGSAFVSYKDFCEYYVRYFQTWKKAGHK